MNFELSFKCSCDGNGVIIDFVKCFTMKIHSGMVYLDILAEPAKKEKNYKILKTNLIISTVYS